MRSLFFKKNKSLLGLVLLILPSSIYAVEVDSFGPNFFKLNKESHVFHFDRKKEENYLKAVMWKQYQKSHVDTSFYSPGKITYAKNAETIELLEKETYATKRGTASRYYEEGGVGYAFMDKEIPTHSLTMYRIKVLTGEAAGKEGWIYKSSLGPRTRKPQRQNKSESMSKTGNFIVRLKSGKIIVSPLYQEEDGVVTIKKAGKIVSYPKSEILSIKNLGG
mgnify:CR=1 FL=1